MTRIHTLKSEPAPAEAYDFHIGDRAVFLDGGRAEKVYVRSEAFAHPESGETMRVCDFVDEGGARYEVKASCLIPCDAKWKLLGAMPEPLRVSWRDGKSRDDLVLKPKRGAPASILDQYDRGPAVEPPRPVDLSQAVLNASQLQRLAEGSRLSAKEMPYRDRREGRKILRKLHDELATQAENAEAAAYFVGAIRAAGLTEDDLVNDGKALRMTSVDGLESLLLREKITGKQFSEGMAYRKARQAMDSGPGAQRIQDAGHTAHDNDMFVYTALQRAKLTTRVSLIDRKVALEAISHPSALQMLHWVAGQGRAISAFGEGSYVKRNVLALRFALDVAATVPHVVRQEDAA